MATKTKTFDCIEAKRKAHRRMMAEYESRKREFPSLVEFLNAKAEESDIAKSVRQKIARAHSTA